LIIGFTFGSYEVLINIYNANYEFVGSMILLLLHPIFTSLWMLRGGIKDRFFHFIILFKFTILFFIHIFDINIYIYKKTLKTKKKKKLKHCQANGIT
jgi:hypothetical protein